MARTPFLDRPDAGLRVLWAWRAGLDTVAIAAFLGIAEADAERLLLDERAHQRARTPRYGLPHLARLHAAWTGEDVDRHEVARRFGYRDARAASSAVNHYRRVQREIAGVAA